MIKTCYVCNKQFDAKPSNKKICDACRDRILDAVHHHKPGVCTVCGKKFKPFKRLIITAQIDAAELQIRSQRTIEK